MVEAQESQGNEPNIEEILAGFGSPRELAEAYVSHIIQGSPPPAGFSAIKSIQRGVSASLYWITAILGYLIGMVMLGLSVVKLWLPEKVGVWSAANGNSLVVGMVDQIPPQTTELLGSWFTPVFLLSGVGLLRLTYLILKALKRI